jgi:hypothetical protein
LCLEKKTTEQHARHTFCFFFTMDFRYFRQVKHEREAVAEMVPDLIMAPNFFGA